MTSKIQSMIIISLFITTLMGAGCGDFTIYGTPPMADAGAGGTVTVGTIVNLDGSGLVNLTSDSRANEWSPTWSPNGRQIAFVTDRDGNYEIYRMDADGANPVNLTNLPESDESQPHWR